MHSSFSVTCEDTVRKQEQQAQQCKFPASSAKLRCFVPFSWLSLQFTAEKKRV